MTEKKIRRKGQASTESKDRGGRSTRRRTKLAKTKSNEGKEVIPEGVQAGTTLSTKQKTKTSTSILCSGSLILAVVVRMVLLVLIMSCLVFVDVSFMRVSAITQRPRLKLPKSSARDKIQSLVDSPKATANDIVSDAISDLDGLLEETREKRANLEKATLDVIRDPSNPLRQEIVGKEMSDGLQEVVKVVRCRKRRIKNSADVEDENEDEDLPNAYDMVNHTLTFDGKDQSFDSGTPSNRKCKEDEEEYIVEVERAFESAGSEAKSSTNFVIDSNRLKDILIQAEDEVMNRRGKLGNLVLKDGFDIRGVSKQLDHHFLQLLDDPAQIPKDGRARDKRSARPKQGTDQVKLPDDRVNEHISVRNVNGYSNSSEKWYGSLERKIRTWRVSSKLFNLEKAEMFIEFKEQLRESGRTFSHFKRSDFERGLKQLGFKQQSSKSGKRAPLWVGYEGQTCPQFKKSDDVQIAFCAHYLPDYKEQEQYQFLLLFSRQNPNIPLKSFDFFPQTWRLYKLDERRKLKARCGNESLSNEGGPYVTKYTVGSTIGLSLGMWDKLKHSDRSMTTQVKEAKNKAIVQVYINNPYIYEGRKFIIRSYSLIVSRDPMIVLFHDGALYRSVSKFTPFTRRDGNYHRSSHFTNDQKSHGKGPLKSSNLYSSLDIFQDWLTENKLEQSDFVLKLRRQIRAMVIIALYALLRPKVKGYKGPPTLPPNVIVMQPVCFDFLLDRKKKVWFLGANTGSHCYVNIGGPSFRPPWKQELMTQMTDNALQLAQEILWRKVNKLPISSMSFITQTGLDFLVDETFPDWDYAREIQDHLEGNLIRQVDPKKRSQDHADTSSETESEPATEDEDTVTNQEEVSERNEEVEDEPDA